MAIDYSANVRKIGTRLRRYSRSNKTWGTQYRSSQISIEIQRVAEDTKFLGQVVTARLSIKSRAPTEPFSTDDRWDVDFYNREDATPTYEFYFPHFYTTEVHTNENTGGYTITAYDKIKDLDNTYTLADLNLPTSYTISELANKIAKAGSYTIGCNYINIPEELVNLSFPNGANLEGNETIINTLSWIAEVLGAVCYVDSNNYIVFRRLDKEAEADATIYRRDYYSLDAGEGKRLGKIIYATELGDNIEAHTVENGSTQVISNNPFLDNRTDRGDLIQQMIEDLGGLTISTFEMEWHANPQLQIGDKLDIERKDGTFLTTYLLDETLTYDGGLVSKLRYHWDQEKYSDDTDANPSTIGDAINQTYAKVDKVDKRIELVASDVQEHTESIAGITDDLESVTSRVSTNETKIGQLVIDTESIAGTVANHTSSIETITTTTIPSIVDKVDNLKVGGRNLATKTAIPVTTQPTGTNSYGQPAGIFPISDFGKTLVEDTENTEFTVQFDWVSTNFDEARTMQMSFRKTSAGSYGSVGATFEVPVGDSSGSVKHTFTPTDDQRTYGLGWLVSGFGANNNRNATVTISNFKLEVGNTATTWTVAPEDLENEISTAQTAADTANNELVTVKTQVQSNTDKIGTLTTTSESISGRVSNVESTTTTITTTVEALQDTVDNIDVGGRNLLKNTATPKVTAGSANNSVYTDYWYETNFGIEVANSGEGEYFTISYDWELAGNSSENASIYFQFRNAIGNSKNVVVGTETSGKIVDSFKLTSVQVNSANKRARIRLQNATDGAVLTVKNIKWEKGNKATTYTVAPEDTDSTLAQLQSDLTSTSSLVSTTVSRVGELETTAEGIRGRVSNVETSITQNTGAIGDLQTYVDQLEVGGRNLLLDTNAANLIKVSAKNNRYYSSSSVTTVIPSFIEVDDAPVKVQNGNQYVITATGTQSRALTWYNGGFVKLVEGDTYTLSCYARKTDGDKVVLLLQYGASPYIHLLEAEVTNTEWKRYSVTFTYEGSNYGDTTGTGTRIYIGALATYLGTLQTCGYKLEKGTQATDWTPAPEDVDYNIYVAKNTADTATETITEVTARVSTLEQNADGISATVSSHTTSISTLTDAQSTQANNITALQAAMNSLGTRNYIINTLVPDVSTTGKRPRLVNQNANTSCQTGVQATVAEHGIRDTCGQAARPFIRFGTSTASAANLNGLEAGETYTLSFDTTFKLFSGTIDNDNDTYYRVYLYTDTATTGTFASTSYKTIKTITKARRGVELEVNKFFFTFTVPENATILYLYVCANVNTASYYDVGDFIELRNIQLEKGSVATDWNAAPEDYQAAIAQAEQTLSNDIANTQSSLGDLTGNLNDLTNDLDGVKDNLTSTADALTSSINELKNEVSLRMTDEEFEIAVNEKLSNGVKSVETETGYRFDKDGLTIAKSDSELTTKIDNTGMKVTNSFEDVLTATSSGVNAIDLTARNFLIVGTRFLVTDYGEDQVGFFYIGS